MSSKFGRHRNSKPLCPRCVNCSMSLRRNLIRHTIKELNEQIVGLLRLWITPTQISSDDILCSECLTLLQHRLSSIENQSEINLLPAFGHKNVCFGCGISLVRRRNHKVAIDCPERKIILQWTPVHQVEHLERSCIACWSAANREVQRLSHHDFIRPEEVLVGPSNAEFNVAVPEIPAPPPPPPPPRKEQPQIQQPQSAKIKSSIYKRVSASSRHCLFTGCKETERLSVPSSLKELLLLRHKLYIPLSARICHYHLQSNVQWAKLNAPYSDFTSFQVDEIFLMLSKAGQRRVNFNNISLMDPHLCQYWLGVTAKQFMELLEKIPRLKDLVKKPTLALSILLVKVRTRDSNQRLSMLFNLPRSSLERHMNIVKRCLMEQNMPILLENTEPS